MNYKITKDNCAAVISELIKSFISAELEGQVSLLVYGSYFSKWRDGVSDLDAMVYFHKTSLYETLLHKIALLQEKVGLIYKKFEFLKTGHFFSDVFVLDRLHGTDGRFLIYDKGFIDRMLFDRVRGAKIQITTQTKYSVLFGDNFISELNPVSLRHQDEYDLTLALCKLRNYLFFEIPKGPAKMDFTLAKEMVKCFKILPRNISIILGEKMVTTPNALKSLRNYFMAINYEPLENLWEKNNDSDFQEEYLESWHEHNNVTFVKCLICYEETLQQLVANLSTRSLRSPR